MSVTSYTTVERVKNTAPETVADIDSQTLDLLITDAHTVVLADFLSEIYVNGNDLSESIHEQAERYLTLHFASMDSDVNKGVASEQVSVLKTSYFKPDYTVDWFSTSIWGSRYWDLWLRYGRGGRFNFALAQH